MENFIQGILAVSKLTTSELSVLYHSPLIKGFAAGYLISTLIYGFIFARKRRLRCEEIKK